MLQQVRITSVAIWTAVALVSALAWSVLALSRGEEVSAAWLVAAALGSYAIAYRFYSKFIAYRALRVDRTRATPAERLNDGVDYHPTDRRVLLGHHFASISGAGPLVGPVLAAQMGYLPGTIWIIAGVIFAGAVQDMVVMFFSARRDGRSLGSMIRDEIGPVGGIAALVAVFAILIILLGVLALVVLNALAESPWGTFSTAMTMPVAVFMGLYLRYLRPGRVAEVTAIGIALLLFSIVAGRWVAESSWAEFFTLSPQALVGWLVAYGFVASVLPVWLLLAPRDYLSTFLKIGTIGLLFVGVLIANPTLQMDAVTEFASRGDGPVFAGSLFPFVFITIACGALSGFHALVASGTTPKMVQKEPQVRPIGYGGMLMESSVAVLAIIAACVLDPAVYLSMNAPPSVIGDTFQSAAETISGLGYVITPEQLQAVAASVEADSLLSKTGGAPTFALGVAVIFAEFLGGESAMAFWYHFAIMFEVLFILTTIDSGTRIGRFMLQEVAGKAYPRFRDHHWKPGVLLTSGVVAGLWGYFLWVGVNDPLGGIRSLFPVFGISNQLLAAIALTICTTLMIKAGRVKYVWVTAVPLFWVTLVTLVASWQKVFSADPDIGFFAQRALYRDAIAAGESLGGQTEDQMRTVVTNATVNGVISAVFAILVVIIIVDASRVCVQALRHPDRVVNHETPHVTSRIIAPDGILATKAERAELAAAGLPSTGGVPGEFGDAPGGAPDPADGGTGAHGRDRDADEGSAR
ncbi:carbon starvation CstA family protein [Streptomyces bohaiensis]|uniref:Carbon starvation protein A n=1 Tax=Streptomyces bohaiensis TaxID=1431344 RepID=A0ABX1CBZ7_9ACTN|nr:carbon starvation CstA family protein [Streptomyces bohaiensis]NJQ16634.1 carbon starvation protein A [Streptomyces bohaiensis]